MSNGLMDLIVEELRSNLVKVKRSPTGGYAVTVPEKFGGEIDLTPEELIIYSLGVTYGSETVRMIYTGA